MLSIARRSWRNLSPLGRHWLINIAIGVVLELVLHAVAHMPNFPVVTAARNGAMDAMMRAVAAQPGRPPAGGLSPNLALVAIDDTTWRDPKWGGGEPYRAPRGELLKLIERAFESGANQIVLDVLVEGFPSEAFQRTEDQAFAAGLDRLLSSPHFSPPRQLVLVRSLRQPYPLRAQTVGQELGPYIEGFLPEVRESPAIDAVVERSQGRILIAAPYFKYSSDRILRDWQLLQVVCKRLADGGGRLWTLPSVQLAVVNQLYGVSNRSGLPADALPDPTRACQPFPLVAPADAAGWSQVDKQAADAGELASAVRQAQDSRWSALQRAYAGAGASLKRAEFDEQDLGNRVVFRFVTPPMVVTARDLLEGKNRQSLQDHVVVIGQTYSEVPDLHNTPLGQMTGPVVLLNAIDSMARYGVIQPPSAALTWGLAFVLILLVGYVYARWDSLGGTLLLSVVIIVGLVPLSFALFKYGVWLDLALPVLGIQIHRFIKTMEERWESRNHAREHKNTSNTGRYPSEAPSVGNGGVRLQRAEPSAGGASISASNPSKGRRVVGRGSHRRKGSR